MAESVRTGSRRGSLFITFKDSQKLDIRAHQRTYDGAYKRGAIAILVFSIMVTKLFDHRFLPMGIVFTIYGTLLFIISIYRTNEMSEYYEEVGGVLYYKTSGNIILLITLISLLSYLALLVLILRL